MPYVSHVGVLLTGGTNVEDGLLPQEWGVDLDQLQQPNVITSAYTRFLLRLAEGPQVHFLPFPLARLHCRPLLCPRHGGFYGFCRWHVGQVGKIQ